VKTFGGAHVALLYYPKFDRRTEESIRAFRMKYDPFADSWEPHIPFIFPVPCDIVDEGKFIKHVETVLKNWAPFSIRIGGFAKSWDHWLFLLLKEGNEEAIALHDELYTGALAPQLRRDIDYVPHTGIGLFVRKDVGYNVLDPKVVDFDAKLFSQALKEAESLKIDSLDTIDRLVVNKVILKTGPSLQMDRLLVSSKEIKL